MPMVDSALSPRDHSTDAQALILPVCVVQVTNRRKKTLFLSFIFLLFLLFQAPVDPSMGGAPRDADLHPSAGVGLQFTVIGSVGEVVPVTIVAPPPQTNVTKQTNKASKQQNDNGFGVLNGTVIVVAVEIGSSGAAVVSCRDVEGCVVKHSARPM
jgi:hypothetical protein